MDAVRANIHSSVKRERQDNFTSTFSGGQNVGLDITADNGDVLFSQQGFDDLAIYLDVCLEDSTCYTATLSDLSGEGLGWNGGYFWVSTGFVDLIHAELPAGTPELQLEFGIDGTCGEVIDNTVLGCTDPAAWNYNPWATEDDGSCLYDEGVYGCTDPVASNYSRRHNRRRILHLPQHLRRHRRCCSFSMGACGREKFS